MQENNADLFRFSKNMIAFRHAHPVLRPRYHMQNADYKGTGLADISWHGVQAWNADWSESSKVLAFMLDGKHAKNGTVQDNTLYMALNTYWDALPFELPAPPEGEKWHLFANTSMPSPDDICEPGSEVELADQSNIVVGGRSTVVLIAK